MARIIPQDQLIINADGSVFHLSIKPSQLKNSVILVGDPNRVAMISSLLDSVLERGENREFVWASGIYKGKEVTILSTGIGSDNIDIVMNELDALVNVDFATRQEKSERKSLNIVRLGTCGIINPDIEEGEIIVSRYAIGIDALMSFYCDADNTLNYQLSNDFVSKLSWPDKMSQPYAIECSSELHAKLSTLGHDAITVTAPGFYAPQGRMVRIKPIIPELVELISQYEFDGCKVSNLEMEAAPIMSMAKLLGHNAITLCVGIAGRKKFTTNLCYHTVMRDLAKAVLERI
ncbi:MAG: nucleoside phosphorylase [Rikenellaceae bacterium]